MVLTIQSLSRAAIVIASISISVAAQTVAAGSAARTPSKPIRPFVVLPAQSLGDLERKLQPSNKTEELIGGEGMELRVAVQHEKNTAAAAGELHDASDDVYYVIE